MRTLHPDELVLVTGAEKCECYCARVVPGFFYGQSKQSAYHGVVDNMSECINYCCTGFFTPGTQPGDWCMDVCKPLSSFEMKIWGFSVSFSQK